jgi:hypothetical protein
MTSPVYTFGSYDEPRTIVIAWLVEGFEIVKFGRPDLGIPPKVKMILEPRAVVWLNRGIERDVYAAEAYAGKLDADHLRPKVFVYHPTREEDPIGRAKREILGLGRAPILVNAPDTPAPKH